MSLIDVRISLQLEQTLGTGSEVQAPVSACRRKAKQKKESAGKRNISLKKVKMWREFLWSSRWFNMRDTVGYSGVNCWLLRRVMSLGLPTVGACGFFIFAFLLCAVCERDTFSHNFDFLFLIIAKYFNISAFGIFFHQRGEFWWDFARAVWFYFRVSGSEWNISI